MEMWRSSAEGKKPKSKVSKTYFRMSSSSTAQKQLKPFTFLSDSHTLDLNQVEMPITVRLTPSSTEAFSMKPFSPWMLLSPTSVSMMIRFSQLTHSFYFTKEVSSFFESSNPLLIVVPPPLVIESSCVQTLSGRSRLQVGAKTTWPELLKVVSPTESLGRSLDMNILMASTESLRRERKLFWLEPSPPPIEPEMSRQMRALIGVSSRSAPSLLLLRKSARQSLTPLSNLLRGNWQREQPMCRSTILSVRLPRSNLISLKTPSQVRWVTSGREELETAALKPRVFRAPIMHIISFNQSAASLAQSMQAYHYSILISKHANHYCPAFTESSHRFIEVRGWSESCKRCMRNSIDYAYTWQNRLDSLSGWKQSRTQ